MQGAEPGACCSPWGFASAEEAEKHSRCSKEELYPHKTFYLFPDFTGSSFLAFLSQGSVLLGKDQMLPVYTCFTEVFPFVRRILFEARNENSFDCCLLDYFEAVWLGEDVQSLISESHISVWRAAGDGNLLQEQLWVRGWGKLCFFQ